MTSDNTIIKSTNFNVNKDGNMSCSNATLTKGKLDFYKSNNTWVATLEAGSATSLVSHTSTEALILNLLQSSLPTFMIKFKNRAQNLMEMCLIPSSNLANYSSTSDAGLLTVGNAISTSNIFVNTIQPPYGTSSNQVSFTSDIYTPKRVLGSEFVNTSEKELKENIYKLKSNSKNKNITRKAIDIIKDTDICEYNFKGQIHKQIGVIIGEKYNTPDEILSEDKKGVDLYSMISTVYRAFQEYIEEQEKIKNMQDNKIQELTQKIEEIQKEIKGGKNAKD